METTVQQTPLFDLQPEYQTSYAAVKVDEIMLPAGHAEPIPSLPLTESIQRYGVLQPIAVGPCPPDGPAVYEVIFGTRRLAAVKLLGLATIPCLVHHGNWRPFRTEIALAENQQRSENVAATVDMIEEMAKQGKSVEAIHQEVGMSIQTVKRYLPMVGMQVDLRTGLRSGAIKPTVAERAAKLPTPQQEQLAATFRETGKVTGRDVATAREDRAQATMAALDGVFSPVVAIPWEVEVQSLIARITAIVPQDKAAEVIGMLTEAFAETMSLADQTKGMDS